MSCYPTSAAGLGYVSYPVGPTASGDVNLTAPGANNTKGAYAQIVASTPFACTAVQVSTTFTLALSRQFLIDIATGAGGAEVVKIPDLLTEGYNVTGSWNNTYWQVPLAVDASTRLSARFAINDITSIGTFGICVSLSAAGGQPGITSFTNLGADTSDSGGAQVDPGGTANTFGTYTQMVASSAAVYQYLAVLSTTKGNSALTSARWCINVATGAAASEVVLIPDLRVSAGGAAPNRYGPRCLPYLTYIAASTRIAVNASCGINDATDRLIDVALLVGTAPTETGSAGGAWAYA